MFEAEAQGLQQCWKRMLSEFPNPLLGHGSAYLVLEWLELGRGTQAWEDGALSGSNALTHQQQKFWLKQNNTIPRPKSIPGADWVKFIPNTGWVIIPALYSGEGIFLNRKVTSGYPSLLAHQPQPSLVHVICGVGMQLYCVR